MNNSQLNNNDEIDKKIITLLYERFGIGETNRALYECYSNIGAAHAYLEQLSVGEAL